MNFKHAFLWTFRSSARPGDWRSWGCLALTKQALLEKCVERYGRVPSDCIPVRVLEYDVPEIGWSERSTVLSQLMYCPKGVEFEELTYEQENERIRISNAAYAIRKEKGEA